MHAAPPPRTAAPPTADATATAPAASDPPATAPGTAGQPDPYATPVVLDRREGPYGEVVLRRHDGLLQIIANGCFLMDTSDGRSERLLVDAALDTLAARGERPGRPALLLGGLGVGFSLVHAAADPRWGRISVVERERAIIDWHTAPAPDGTPAPLAALTADALADPRTTVVHADLLDHLRTAPVQYDALCLDIDNGPGWTVTDDNAGLYTPDGLTLCRARLTPGGVLAVWSAKPSPEFETALQNAGFQAVHTEEIPVARGVPDVVHIAVGPG